MYQKAKGIPCNGASRLILVIMTCSCFISRDHHHRERFASSSGAKPRRCCASINWVRGVHWRDNRGTTVWRCSWILTCELRRWRCWCHGHRYASHWCNWKPIWQYRSLWWCCGRFSSWLICTATFFWTVVAIRITTRGRTVPVMLCTAHIGWRGDVGCETIVWIGCCFHTGQRWFTSVENKHDECDRNDDSCASCSWDGNNHLSSQQVGQFLWGRRWRRVFNWLWRLQLVLVPVLIAVGTVCGCGSV